MQAFITRFLTSRIGRDVLGSMSLKIANVGLTFLATVLLARLLGPAEYGVFAFVYAVISLLSVPSEFGLPALVVRETARGILRQDYAAVQGIWRWSGRTIAWISFSIAVFTLAGLWIFREPIAGPRSLTFLCALALVPLVALGDLRGAALSGLHRIVAGQLPEFLIRPGFFALFLLAFFLLGESVLTASSSMLLYVASAALAFGVGAWLLHRLAPTAVHQAVPRFENRLWLLSALPLAFISGLQLIDQQASILLQGFFLQDEAIGIYRIASQVSLLASFGLMTINLVLAPRFATLSAKGDTPALQRLVTNSARVILLINLILTVGFVVGGRIFLRIAFGPEYEGAYLPLVILLAGQLVNSAAGSVGQLLNMSGHERETVRATVVSALLNIVLNLLLMPRWGIDGSAVATSFSLIVWNVLLWWAVRKKLGINSLAFG